MLFVCFVRQVLVFFIVLDINLFSFSHGTFRKLKLKVGTDLAS